MTFNSQTFITINSTMSRGIFQLKILLSLQQIYSIKLFILSTLVKTWLKLKYNNTLPDIRLIFYNKNFGLKTFSIRTFFPCAYFFDCHAGRPDKTTLLPRLEDKSYIIVLRIQSNKKCRREER